jgi:hypothetical protein
MHADARARERTDLKPAELNTLRRALRRHRKKRLDPYKTYHYEWPGRGYAVIAPARDGYRTHVVKTVLSPYMQPPGERLEMPISTMKLPISGLEKASGYRDMAMAGARTAKKVRPKRLKIVYIGPSRGAGHLEQARNLATAAAQMGIDAETLNFDEEFGRPDDLRDYKNTYSRFLNKKTGIVDAGRAHLKFYARADHAKIRQFLRDNRDSSIVLTNPHLHAPFAQGKNPIHVLHTDPVKWTGEVDWPARGPRIHLGTKEVIRDLNPSNGKALSGLPVNPRLLKRQTKTGLLGKKDFNITVSGGVMGLEVPELVRRIQASDLPENAKIHAVAGRNKKVLRSLQSLAKKDKRVVAHGFAPLPGMMQEANLNVIRSHGTTFAETVAAGKPAVYYAPAPRLTDFQGKLTRDTALYGERTVGNPSAVGLDAVAAAVDKAIKNRTTLERRAQLAKQRFGNPANQAVIAAMRPMEEYKEASDVFSAFLADTGF